VRVPFAVSLVALALAPVPALANDIGEPALADAAAELSDPVRQEQAAVMVEAMMGALMQMPVGPMMRAAADMAGEDPEAIDPDTRVADIAGPQAAEAGAEMSRRLPQMMEAMAGMAGALDAMLPQLRAMAETMRTQLPEAR
jgi:hypothetical protein